MNLSRVHSCACDDELQTQSSPKPESNRRPPPYQGSALPSELFGQKPHSLVFRTGQSICQAHRGSVEGLWDEPSSPREILRTDRGADLARLRGPEDNTPIETPIDRKARNRNRTDSLRSTKAALFLLSYSGSVPLVGLWGDITDATQCVRRLLGLESPVSPSTRSRLARVITPPFNGT